MMMQPRRALGDIGNRISNLQGKFPQDSLKPATARAGTTTTSTFAMPAASARMGFLAGARKPAASVALAGAQPRQPAPISSGTTSLPATSALSSLPTLRSTLPGQMPLPSARFHTSGSVTARPPSTTASLHSAAPTPASSDSSPSPIQPHHILPPVELGNYDDIDLNDAGNPQAVSEYVQDIYEYLMELEQRERVSENFLSIQTEVTDRIRSTLVDYLVDVHMGFQMLPETLFLTVNVLDRFLALKPVAQNKLQMVGITALLVAAKYEETYIPQLKDFVNVTDMTCTKADLIRTERMILSSLKFSLSVPTSLSFLKRYAKAAQADNTIGMLSRFMAELALMDAHISAAYRPSIVAAAAIYHALRCTHNPGWTANLQHYSGYTEADLTPCAHELRELVRRAPTGKLQAVFRKYSQQKYLGVARLCAQEI
ncbi:putative G2/mitotic-specific cyclin-B [Paratrimastix pyriformis]|uniref:G2/mitotic-specific cyclin-B n=1 Tax=Paratrimastix pyriformis TaxID=342808 RepID=A0ABQ8UNB7_9EUKA|nr:putative G2/mitotic-specific cyclin-B [Paratrimastix pyriformis]|eukprot:GAFH01001638.1.p1 GENE.GAFH01001638.1~~GAFH01001638.1.p1  ORF type:complete len:428 (-),score=111.71 GAFH01001638.1:165-1448(-)